jgi:MbtH protein
VNAGFLRCWAGKEPTQGPWDEVSRTCSIDPKLRSAGATAVFPGVTESPRGRALFDAERGCTVPASRAAGQKRWRCVTASGTVRCDGAVCAKARCSKRDAMSDEVDDREYLAVVNHEEQYSIWFADQKLPLGWTETGKRGTKQECLDYIRGVWTDMRPLSLRTKMREHETAE